MAGLDILTLDTTTLSEQGVAMPLRDPRVRRDYEQAEDTRPWLVDDDGNAITITVLGPDNPKVARLLLPQRARFQTAALAAQGRKGVTFTMEDMRREEAESVDIAVAATVAWSGFTKGGEPLSCTAENARALYTSNGDVRDQVIAFVRDRGNFLPRASTR